MPLPKILLILDTDPQPSVFDAVVAVDAGVDQLLRHGGIVPDRVRDLVYGAMFTRGPAELQSTAIFIGGTDVAAGEKLLAKTRECFFGPMRVSVMLDSNGANTTAAAAVLSAGKHIDLSGQIVTVLGATGSVGRRVVKLLAREGARVRVASRQVARAMDVCEDERILPASSEIEAWETSDDASTGAAIEGAQVVIAAGAPGVQLLPEKLRTATKSLRVAIDLNAVPPSGIGGILAQDKGAQRDGQICYGALGVGGLKMKLHKTAVRRLFESNDIVLDAEEIYELGSKL